MSTLLRIKINVVSVLDFYPSVVAVHPGLVPVGRVWNSQPAFAGIVFHVDKDSSVWKLVEINQLYSP